MKIHKTAKEVYDENGNPAGKLPDGNIRFSSLPKSGFQRIAKKMLDGVLKPHTTINDKAIVIHSKDGDVVFDIIYPPGRFCLTCGEKLPNIGEVGSEEEAERAKECRDHVKTHGTKAETSKKWSHGYRSSPGAYDCSIRETDLTKRLMRAGA